MYGIFTYIWVIFRANVGKYSIHGAYGIYNGHVYVCMYTIELYIYIYIYMYIIPMKFTLYGLSQHDLENSAHRRQRDLLEKMTRARRQYQAQPGGQSEP